MREEANNKTPAENMRELRLDVTEGLSSLRLELREKLSTAKQDCTESKSELDKTQLDYHYRALENCNKITGDIRDEFNKRLTEFDKAATITLRDVEERVDSGMNWRTGIIGSIIVVLLFVIGAVGSYTYDSHTQGEANKDQYTAEMTDFKQQVNTRLLEFEKGFNSKFGDRLNNLERSIYRIEFLIEQAQDLKVQKKQENKK